LKNLEPYPLDAATLERARAFIASVEWTFAKTRARYNPHHYHGPESRHGGPEFSAFVAFVRQAPIRRWRGGRYHCLTVDERDYFLTHAGAAGWIINTKPSASAGWDPEPPPTRDRREVVWHDFEHGLISERRRDELLRDLEAR
jgi:hypothetical protein